MPGTVCLGPTGSALVSAECGLRAGAVGRWNAHPHRALSVPGEKVLHLRNARSSQAGGAAPTRDQAP